MNEKQCTKCGETKPIKCFSPSKKVKSGYESWCNQCKYQSRLRREQKHPEIKAAGIEYKKRWRQLPKTKERKSNE